MRAVNLLPSDQRRGASAPGRSGIAVYVLLGALGALVVAVGAYVMATNQVNSNRADLAKAEQEAVSLERQAAIYKPYEDFAKLSQARVETVAQLADSRFDWEQVMRELARALPGDVWLTSLVGTVAPGVTIDGGSSSNTGSLRSALPSPAVELVGCTESQAAVSRVMARLRTINSVQRVSLASSEKSETTSVAGSAGGGGSSGDCRYGSAHFPQFQLVVFFEPPKGALGGDATAPGAAAPAQGQAAAATTSPATSTASAGGAK